MLAQLLTILFLMTAVHQDAKTQSPSPRSAPVINRPMSLLVMPVVQRELGLTKEQKAKLTKTIAESNRRTSERIAEHHAKQLEEARQEQHQPSSPVAINTSDITSEEDISARGLLTKKQAARLEQIMLQLAGVTALGREEIAIKVNLSSDQLALVRQILNQTREAQYQSMAAFGEEEKQKNVDFEKAALSVRTNSKRLLEVEKSYRDGFAKRNESLQERTNTMRLGAREKIARLLTRKQRESFDRLLGEPFDFNPPPTPITGEKKPAPETEKVKP